METKVCSYCKEEKNIEEFRYTQGKYRGECKKCEAYKHKLYCQTHKDVIKRIAHKTYANNIEKYHERAIQDREKRKLYNKEYRETHKEYYKEHAKNYYIEHRKQIDEKDKIWRNKNKDKVRAMQQRDYEKRRNNPISRLKGTLRNMVKDAFKKRGFTKSKKLEEICCCSIDFLIEHLITTYEQNYSVKWNWDYVKDVHVDHIIPLVTAHTEEEVIKLCHYKNLQLLKSQDNLKKGISLFYTIK